MSTSIGNEQIASILASEAEKREGYGATALVKASRIIATFPVPITDVAQLKGVRGIGDGTCKRVAAILLEGVEKYIMPVIKTPVIKTPEGYDFSQIKFFGPVANRNLHALGITTLTQLENSVAEALQRYDDKDLSTEQGIITVQGATVTANQLAGLRYREHLAVRVPRAEVKELGEEILRIALPLGLKGEIVGSYRRGRPDSGDVDVLLTGDRNRLAELIQQLWDMGIVRYKFSLGEVKAMLVAVRPKSLVLSPSGEMDVSREEPRRSLDIRYVPPESFGTAMLFATGSDAFNVHQRQIAIQQGFKLSEYGLTDASGTKLPAFTEQDVFNALGMKYLSPAERDQYTTVRK